jgi:hypothetical protein
MHKTLQGVAERIQREIGLSRTASRRIAEKLNTLARSVDWATPLGAQPAAAKQTRHRRLRRKAA